MTVQELIDKLAALPPDLEIWGTDHYGTGVCASRFTPSVQTLCLHSTNGNPRFQSSLQYQRNADKWTPSRQVVSL